MITYYIFTQLILMIAMLILFYRNQKKYKNEQSFLTFITNPKYYFSLFHDYGVILKYKEKTKKNRKKSKYHTIINPDIEYQNVLITYPMGIFLFIPVFRLIIFYMMKEENEELKDLQKKTTYKRLNETLCCKKCNVYTRTAYVNLYIKKHYLDYDTNICPTCEEKDVLEIKELPMIDGKTPQLEHAPLLKKEKEFIHCMFIEETERYTWRELKSMYQIASKGNFEKQSSVYHFEEEQKQLFLQQREQALNKHKLEGE